MPRNNDPAVLHAVFRAPLRELVARCAAADVPVALYEGVRSPLRQVELYARGRGKGERGKAVTRARAWDSLHQHGVAADLVFYVGGKWTWDEPRRGAWEEFTTLAGQCGLRTLSFERPHVELPVSLADLKAGRWPAGGGDAWQNWIETEIENWGRAARDFDGITHPSAPPLPSMDERPPLVLGEGLPPSPFGGG